MAHEDLELWRAIVTFDSTAPLTDEQAGALTAHLPIAVDRIDGEPGKLQGVEQDARGTHLSMIVPAGSLIEAVDEARQSAHEAYIAVFGVAGRLIAAHVLTEVAYREELTRPSPMDLIGVAEIGEMAGVSRERGRQLTHLPDFPPALATVRATVVYTRLSVELFLQRWPRMPAWAGHHAQADRDAAKEPVAGRAKKRS